MRTAGTAFMAAVITLVLGAVGGMVGFRVAWVVLAPGFLAAWFGTGPDGGRLFAFFAVNVGVWWAAWAGAIVLWRWVAAKRAGRDAPGP